MMKLVFVCLATTSVVSSALLHKKKVQNHGATTVKDYETPSLLQETEKQLLLKPGVATIQDSSDEVQRRRLRKRFQKRSRNNLRRNQKYSTAKAKTQTTKGSNKRGGRRRILTSLSDFDSKTIDMAELCKKTLQLTGGSEIELVSPTDVKNCKTSINVMDGEGKLSMKCPVFELDSKGCRQEALSISKYKKACGTDGPDISGAKSLKLTYKTKTPGTSVGFMCTINVDTSSPEQSENRKICADCGVAQVNSVRIVGGQETKKNEYPWMLSIAMMKNGFYITCGASLIAPSWALTAQHCLKKYNASQVLVSYGIHKLNDSFANPIEVDRIELHPDYDSDTLDNDVALIHTKTPVPISGKVRPICVATAPPKTGQVAVVTGWGTLSDGGGYPGVLHEVALNIVSNKECEEKYNPKQVDITASMICAAKKKKDSCTGDSGGPLIVETSKDVWEQVGVVSFGIGCANKKFPGAYARVDYFADWIFSHVSECE